MKKIKIEKINEIIYYDKLDNGLEVYLYPKKSSHNNYVTFTTRFGSVNSSFIPKGKSKKVTLPFGIAHFLEHKVFVQKEDPQPTDFYSKTGTLCNAHTSLRNTTYEFTGPNNLKENIKYLLDYVQAPYFTKENVETEKGIISQEINMVNDRPWNIMYDKIRENGFKKDTVKESIAGSIQDISHITCDMLYDCYNTFYHPSNMFLIITGNFEPEEILEIVRENQANKKFENPVKQLKEKIDEPSKPVKKEEIIYINTDVPKVSYNIKISANDIKSVDRRRLNLYLYIIFNTLIDESSLFDEEAKKNRIISSTTFIDVLNTDDYVLVSLLNEVQKPDEFLESLNKLFKKIDITEEDLERKKKVLYSNELYTYDNVESINQMILDNIIFDNTLNSNIFNVIDSLNIKELKEILKNIDLSNYYSIIIKKK